MKYCEPNIIFPEHYHPRSFIAEQIPEEAKHKFEPANVVVDELAKAISYPVKEIDSFTIEIAYNELKNKKTIYRFMKVHPQVKYRQDFEFNKNW